MRKSIASLCVAATVGAGATAEKKTARMTIKMSVSGAGLPIPLDVNAKGVTALGSSAGKLTIDLAPLLSLAGAPQGTPGDLEVRFRGGTLYAKPPKLPQLQVPGGKSKVASAFDISGKGIGKLFTLEPAAQLRALKAAKGLKRIGEEPVAGAKTTHYRGTYRVSDLVKTLSPAERREVTAAIKQIDELDGPGGASLNDPVPAEVWVDEDGVTRKMLSTAKVPAQAGQPGGTIKQSYVLSDFGTPLDAAPPAAGDTYAATDAVVKALGTLAGQATP